MVSSGELVKWFYSDFQMVRGDTVAVKVSWCWSTSLDVESFCKQRWNISQFDRNQRGKSFCSTDGMKKCRKKWKRNVILKISWASCRFNVASKVAWLWKWYWQQRGKSSFSKMTFHRRPYRPHLCIFRPMLMVSMSSVGGRRKWVFCLFKCLSLARTESDIGVE